MHLIHLRCKGAKLCNCIHVVNSKRAACGGMEKISVAVEAQMHLSLIIGEASKRWQPGGVIQKNKMTKHNRNLIR